MNIKPLGERVVIKKLEAEENQEFKIEEPTPKVLISDINSILNIFQIT